jgi:hypothetical protein
MLLHYPCAADATLFDALNSLASEPSKGITNYTAIAIMQVINYCAMHPNAALGYHTSRTILYIGSDASYLSIPEAPSQVGGHHYLSSCSHDPSKAAFMSLPPNSPIHTVFHRLRHIMASTAEAKTVACWTRAKKALPFAPLLSNSIIPNH